MTKQTEAPARSALKLALEALDGWRKGFPDHWGDIDEYSVDAIREALAEQPAQQQEPVALGALAKRTWVGLTDEEIMESWDEIRDGDWAPDFYAVIEAKLREKNAAPCKPLTDEQKAILKECRNQAMKWVAQARIPECGAFSGIAQDLDWLCNQLVIEAAHGIKGEQK